MGVGRHRDEYRGQLRHPQGGLFARSDSKLEDLDVLIRTHHHVDHFGTSARIKRRSGATTLLHELEVERVNRMLTIGTMSTASSGGAIDFSSATAFRSSKYPLEGMRPTWMGTEMYNPAAT